MEDLDSVSQGVEFWATEQKGECHQKSHVHNQEGGRTQEHTLKGENTRIPPEGTTNVTWREAEVHEAGKVQWVPLVLDESQTVHLRDRSTPCLRGPISSPGNTASGLPDHLNTRRWQRQSTARKLLTIPIFSERMTTILTSQQWLSRRGLYTDIACQPKAYLPKTKQRLTNFDHDQQWSTFYMPFLYVCVCMSPYIKHITI